MRITLSKNTTTMTGVMAGTVMRHMVVSALAPDIRLASSIDASMRRNAGVINITLVEMALAMTCAQIIPQKGIDVEVQSAQNGTLTQPIVDQARARIEHQHPTKGGRQFGRKNEIQKPNSKALAQ